MREEYRIVQSQGASVNKLSNKNWKLMQAHGRLTVTEFSKYDPWKTFYWHSSIKRLLLSSAVRNVKNVSQMNFSLAFQITNDDTPKTPK